MDSTGPSGGYIKAFDVVYLDEANKPFAVAQNVPADQAAVIAKAEAKRRHIGRMFAAGSMPRGQVVIVVPAHSMPRMDPCHQNGNGSYPGQSNGSRPDQARSTTNGEGTLAAHPSRRRVA